VTAALAVVALPATALVIAALLRSPLTRRVVATPRGDRWHEQTTPALGGVGIFAGLVVGVGAALAAGALEPSWPIGGVLGGASVLFLVGLVDDIHPLGVVPKLGAQLGATGIALASGIQVEIVGDEVLATGIAVVWIVGMTNAFNFLDNMDGLAASLAGIALVYLALDAAMVHENTTVLVLAAAGAAACAGFLPFNVRRGKSAAIFMGDSGSQVLGFTLATVALLTSWKQAGTTVATIILPLLILAVPIVDTALVVIVRLLEGRPIYQGGRDHTSHRLVYYGLSERRALVLLALISASLGATSLGYNVIDNSRVALVGVLLTFVLLVQFASFLADIERGPVAPRGGPPLLRGLVVHRRRLVEVVLDFALITAAFLAAYQLRIWDTGTGWDPYVVNMALPALLVARYVTFIPFGLYRGVWRYAGARDAVSVVAAVLLSEALAVGFLRLATGARWQDIPRAVFVVDAVFCIVLVGASRFGERALDRSLVRLRGRHQLQRTLIVGAGRAGRSLLRELREESDQVAGFVDDDPRLRSRRLLGTPVLGTTAELKAVLEAAKPDRVLVTIPDAPRGTLDAVVTACQAAEVSCRFVRRDLDLDPSLVLDRAK
jgi:UDP-GlcNAc:undecaprenyl-phosphate/decaprenyl-phosphate GlcNAc-1-phosphate transferase